MVSNQKNAWRILYIDDDEEDYILARLYLSHSEERKITIDWASSFEDGFRRLTSCQSELSQAYDAVLVDYDLGGKSGIEIIRAFSASYPAPLILYTGRGSHEIDLEAQQAGATMYLTKHEANPLLLERIIRYAIERKQSDHALRQSQEATQRKNEMLSLLNEAAAELLAGVEPITRLDNFLARAGQVLGLEVYVQYNLSEDGTHLNLGKLSGFPDRYLPVLSRLELGQAVCGTVAKIRKPIYVNDVQSQKDKMTRLIRKLGIDTYACHPLIVGGRLYGTLSFGSRSRSRFGPEEIEILKTFCNLVAEAMARKQAEDALRENEKKLRSAFEKAAIGFAMTRPDGRFVDANPAYCRLTGYTLAELQSCAFEQLIHPNDHAENMVWIRQMLDGQTDSFVIENRYVCKDGQTVWVQKSVSLVRDANGAPQWITALVEDVTQRRQAETALKESIEREQKRANELEILMDTAPAMIWIARDQQCQEMTGNRYGYEFLKMWAGANISKTATETDLSQQPYRNFKDGREIPPEALPMQIAAATGKPASNYDFDLVFNDGTVRTVLGNVNPLFDRWGQPAGAVAVFTDITDRREYEQALQHYTEELERSNQALKEFTAIASHDLQEPLRKIQAYGHLLDTQFGSQITMEGKDYLERIKSAAERMSAMMESLLIYSRVTSHSQPFIQVDLSQVAHEVLSDLELRIKETGAEVALEQLPIIQSDPLQMHQLLQNLIGNAIKYHHPKTPPHISISACKTSDKKYTRIVVQDNGIGFGEEDVQRIFQPFVRLHPRTVYEGTGMGLAICQKIVERHGGSIHVDSVPGVGSTFTIDLPLKI